MTQHCVSSVLKSSSSKMSSTRIYVSNRHAAANLSQRLFSSAFNVINTDLLGGLIGWW